ncbi:glycerophosphodiester phosphodiesterase family protein [Novosphingobium album (ex Hu et al. 2023)]|uniref:glycerophosphodiester phosphodiesterase n=1 Tax=Novosphingobium album (ex Hu et al. 2023) TaxID=2930093 RepID=A0ABT0B6M0_9SPHN|nr:glycerophosphodiester phosphodiesterase family protein [Novosphingobium album (ex Hu et al. 2023)]MCJ2180653.1 glycerophosphodiester phosphodiesterase [Novosphingobium album (ex Hu et al. 2023)]
MTQFDLSRRSLIGGALAVAGAAHVPDAFASTAQPPLQRPAKPLVIGHRGAPALRPEHTLASYARAIADGADFIEPDLVATKDGVLIARHENNIAETTDVAARPQFADRKATKAIDGETITGWFTEDFTLAEIKSLRAKERLGTQRPESHSFDGQFQVVTLEEVADFTAAEAAARGRAIGLIPEIKHSTYFEGIGLPLEQRLLDRITASTYMQTAPVIIQSFEVSNLKWLRERLTGQTNVQLMQLTVPAAVRPADLADKGTGPTYKDMHTPRGLADMAAYADWISPNDLALLPRDKDDNLSSTPTGLIGNAHLAGLLVCSWTFRPENHFLPANLRDGDGDGARNPQGSMAEIRAYLDAGLDAFFTDDPAIGREAVNGWHHAS